LRSIYIELMHLPEDMNKIQLKEIGEKNVSELIKKIILIL